jgi:hypothetical protein
MNPAGKARTLVWYARPAYISTLHPSSQGDAARQDSPRSGAIFLLDCKSPYRERFADHLRSLRFKVFVPEEHGKTVLDLSDDELQEADLVIFAFARPTHDAWTQFRRVCDARRHDTPLRVIAWLHGYWDAVFHLMLEKLADRVVVWNE